MERELEFWIMKAGKKLKREGKMWRKGDLRRESEKNEEGQCTENFIVNDNAKDF